MHDVDMIAMDENLSYECSNKNALFLASKRYKYNSKGEKAGIMRGSFGAVSSISPTIFERVNGYSNEFWGWGGEGAGGSNTLFTNMASCVCITLKDRVYNNQVHANDQVHPLS